MRAMYQRMQDSGRLATATIALNLFILGIAAIAFYQSSSSGLSLGVTSRVASRVAPPTFSVGAPTHTRDVVPRYILLVYTPFSPSYFIPIERPLSKVGGGIE